MSSRRASEIFAWREFSSIAVFGYLQVDSSARHDTVISFPSTSGRITPESCARSMCGPCARSEHGSATRRLRPRSSRGSTDPPCRVTRSGWEGAVRQMRPQRFSRQRTAGNHGLCPPPEPVAFPFPVRAVECVINHVRSQALPGTAATPSAGIGISVPRSKSAAVKAEFIE